MRNFLFLLLGSLAGCSAMPQSGHLSSDAGPLIAYSLAGSGTPTLVLQAGLGDDKSTWEKVFPMLAKTHTVFAYDRPGYGASPANDHPRDPCTIASELRSALHAAGLKPPYILVGHSLGGLYQYTYLQLYPDDVAALVLLDATHPQHWQRMQEQAPTQAKVLKGIRNTLFNATEAREFDQQADCVAQWAQTAAQQRPTLILESGRRALGEQGDFNKMLEQSRTDWRKLTGRGNVIRLENSGHHLQLDQANTVSQAISHFAGTVTP